MLELPTRNESSMAVGRRVSRNAGNISETVLPMAEALGMLLVLAIQSFQPTTLPWSSSTMIPTSSPSNTASNATVLNRPGMDGLLFYPFDKISHDFLQARNLCQAHE